MFQKCLIVLAVSVLCICSSQVLYTPEVVSSPYYYPSASSPLAAAYPYSYSYGAAAGYPNAYYGWGSNKGQQTPSSVPTQSLTSNQ
uniref:Nematode Specific Peptide family, group B n=1 Tax=Caenorhabditis tropicalis TaxID=1561998 RepID=A0A1I7UNR0_9PELO